MNREEHSRLVHSFSYGFSEELHAVLNAKDTLELIDYAHPRTYGMAGKTSLLLVYSADDLKVDSGASLHFSINDIITHSGTIEFDFDVGPLVNAPTLQFDTKRLKK